MNESLDLRNRINKMRSINNLEPNKNKVSKNFKIDPKKAGKDLSILIECFRIIGIVLQPFIPNASKKFLDILNIDQIKSFTNQN